jgi:calcium-dependent protein kinase
MGICSSENDKMKDMNKTSSISTKSESQNSNNTKSEKNSSKTKLKSLPSKSLVNNLISTKTKKDDINKYITITDTFLGKGLTGIVREGKNKNNEKFAIKSIWKADVMQNKYFKKEIEITLSLENEYCIKCYEIYEENSAIHFVLELISGGDLFDHIINSPKKKLEDNEIITLFKQMLNSLNYLHNELKVVHRDIKPENFLLYIENNRNKIKLIDFGFSDYIDEKNNFLSDPIGTPQYCAPEIYLGQKYDFKADLWSLGVVLYNMANGTQPFKLHNNNQDLIREDVLHKEINFDGFKNEGLKNLCKNLLERDPNKRFSAVQALSALSLISTDKDIDTVYSEFDPDIKKIIFILNDNKELKMEILKLYINQVDMMKLDKLYNELKVYNKNLNNGEEMLAGRFYLPILELIDTTLKQNYLSEEFKNQLKDLVSKNGKKLENLLMNVNKMFITAINARKFIYKQQVLNNFKKYDLKNNGYLTYDQIKTIFSAPEKQYLLKNYNKNIKIEFEEFYQLYTNYIEKQIPVIHVRKPERKISSISYL